MSMNGTRNVAPLAERGPHDPERSWHMGTRLSLCAALHHPTFVEGPLQRSSPYLLSWGGRALLIAAPLQA
jgi:hypothetical protein